MSATVGAAQGTDRRLRIAIGVLCLVGLGIAGYLTYVHYAGLKVAIDKALAA